MPPLGVVQPAFARTAGNLLGEALNVQFCGVLNGRQPGARKALSQVALTQAHGQGQPTVPIAAPELPTAIPPRRAMP